MTEQPNYYAIIPASVRYDRDLSPNAKLLYGEITALCNQQGYCWASNDYFGQLYGVSNVSISKWVSQLRKKGYIFVEMNYKEGSKEILNRYIRLVNEPIKENFNTSQRKVKDPIKEKFKDNNTYNTTINNTYNNIDQSTSKEADKVSLKNRFELIWKEYPKKMGKEASFNSYQKAIKEGITDETILNGINAYKKQIELQRTELQFIKQGSTFFNQRSYLDEFITSNNKVKYSHQEQEIPPEWAEEFASAGQLNVTDDILLDELPF